MDCIEDSGDATHAHDGDLLLFDNSNPITLKFSDYDYIYMSISRSITQMSIPEKAPTLHETREALNNSNIAHLFKKHLQDFSTALGEMKEVEQDLFLEVTIDFAVAVLKWAFLQVNNRSSTNGGLFVSAQRFIRHNLSDSELTPKEIASVLGCSRSTLYRMFSARGLSVAGYIRELRLQKFLRLLLSSRSDLPIHVLAQNCGLQGIQNLSRLFRNRFGATPSEVRSSGSAVFLHRQAFDASIRSTSTDMGDLIAQIDERGSLNES